MFANYLSVCSKKRVVLIGIDGLNPACIANAPFHHNIDWMMENGASTLKARTIIEAVSAPGWIAIACSLESQDTGAVDNDWSPPWKSKAGVYDLNNSKEKPFSCIFQTIKNQDHVRKTAFLYDWYWLRNLGNEATPQGE